MENARHARGGHSYAPMSTGNDLRNWRTRGPRPRRTGLPRATDNDAPPRSTWQAQTAPTTGP
eukprot:11202261-Lingulodinium_polyedra.AAC.1